MKSSDDEEPRVMGPYAVTASNYLSLNHAPIFITSSVNKVKDRDSVTKWTSMLRMMAITDRKAEARLRSIGLMLYLDADDAAKESMDKPRLLDTSTWRGLQSRRIALI